MVPLPEQLYQQQETSTSDDSSSTNSKTTNPSSTPNLEEQQHLSYLQDQWLSKQKQAVSA